jgi:L-asparagine oxygenase
MGAPSTESLNPPLRYRLQQALEQRGYCTLEGMDPTGFLDFARTLGPITVDRRHPEAMRRISPQSESQAEPNTLSSRFGFGAFPFHTDAAHWRTPPRFVLLLCLDPGSSGRRTRLIDTATLGDPRSREVLGEGVWKAAHRRPFLCRLIERSGTMVRWRYDPACLVPWSPSAIRASTVVPELISSSAVLDINWKVGDLLCLDNWRILHARSGTTVQDGDRCLARILVGGSQDGELGLEPVLA